MSQNKLLNFLLSLQQECGGIIPFERYMQEALYHPLHGYYGAQIQDVGKAGDFSTSATLDPWLGKAIAAWITQRAEELGWKHIPIIEVGAGSGNLALQVLGQLDWKTRLRIDYRIHDTSPILKQKQKKKLRWFGVRWINSLAEELERVKGHALIFSNELVDAFPCRIFEKTHKGWQELGLTISTQGDLSERLLAPVVHESWFDQFSEMLEGQRIERHDSYQVWLQSWCRHWKEGAMLTIDYGDLTDHLYDRSPSGSIRAYWKHQRLIGRDIYARFGKQDLTADVNFSDLIGWGKKLGWKHFPLITQRAFISTMFSKNKEQTLFPEEAGTAFKVLEQQPY